MCTCDYKYDLSTSHYKYVSKLLEFYVKDLIKKRERERGKA